LDAMFLTIRRLLTLRRRRRRELRALERRLRRFGDSLGASPEAKQAGLERLLAEFDRGRERKP
jgi:hypothetical protein